MASKKHGGLGKGLSALGLNTGVVKKAVTPPEKKPVPQAPTAHDSVQKIAIDEIQANRFQPRADFDEAAMEELATSIKVYGVLQPVLVRKRPSGKYELIAGERRLRGAKLAGLSEVPVLIREYNDAELSEIALIENIQREDLNAMEEAQAYQRLMNDFSLTQEVVAERVGRSRSHVANFLRLLKLAPKVQDYVANGSLSMGQAKPLLSLADPALQEKAADMIQTEDLSARQCEALVKRLQSHPEEKEKQEKSRSVSNDIYVQEAVEKLKMLFGTQVSIHTGKKKSKIEIEFYSDEDLERILGAISEHNDAVKQAEIETLRNVSLSSKFTV